MLATASAHLQAHAVLLHSLVHGRSVGAACLPGLRSLRHGRHGRRPHAPQQPLQVAVVVPSTTAGTGATRYGCVADQGSQTLQHGHRGLRC